MTDAIPKGEVSAVAQGKLSAKEVVTHRRVLNIAIPIVISNATVPILGAVDTGVVGQIVVKGETVMREYWGAPEKTAESFRDGWFLTGDAARYDGDGYIVHVGRRSVDILKSGGYKISAREIEEVISRHPMVREVAIVGIPDDEWGQRIGAALVIEDGDDTSRDASWWADELRAFVEGRLADYKRPREVILLEEIPRNALGKVQKHRIDFGA